MWQKKKEKKKSGVCAGVWREGPGQEETTPSKYETKVPRVVALRDDAGFWFLQNVTTQKN